MKRLLPALLLAGCAGTGSTSPPTPTPRPAASATAVPGGRSFAVFAGSSAGAKDGTGTAAQFNGPGGLDVDAVGRFYVAESAGHRIRRVDADGKVTTLAGGAKGFADGAPADAKFDTPSGLVVKRDGTILVADTNNHRIRAIAPDGTVSTLAGDGTAGLAEGAGAAARFHSPLSVALTALDEVLVADTGNHRIRLIDRAGTVSTLMGGEAGYTDGAADSRFNAPADLALDPAGRIYVADVRNHAIRVVDAVAGTTRTLAGTGKAGSKDGAGAAAQFNLPTGLGFDGLGNLYVADAGNGAVRRVAKDGEVVTIAKPGGVADVAVEPEGAIVVTVPETNRLMRAR